MAIATMDTFLVSFTGETKPTSLTGATKVVDITSFPAMGGDPEKIDVTTLTDHIQKQINGVQQLDSLEFGANYTVEDYKKLKALEGKSAWYGLVFGASSEGTPDGHNGVLIWKGEPSTHVNEGSANEAVGMTSTFSCESEIDFLDTKAA